MLYVNFSDKRLKFAPKWSISYFQPILVAIFVTIAIVKVKLIRYLHTLVIVRRHIGEKQFLYFGLIEGPKKPLNARTGSSLSSVGPVASEKTMF